MQSLGMFRNVSWGLLRSLPALLHALCFGPMLSHPAATVISAEGAGFKVRSFSLVSAQVPGAAPQHKCRCRSLVEVIAKFLDYRRRAKLLASESYALGKWRKPSSSLARVVSEPKTRVAPHACQAHKQPLACLGQYKPNEAPKALGKSLGTGP